MKLLHSFLRTFRGTIALAALTGLVSGVSGAALIALINAKLNAGDSGGARLVWSYAGLVALALLSNGLSQYVLVRLAQETSYSLRLRLTREMLAAPLRKLEELGPPKLMAILTEDIPSITAAFMGAPSLCINAATILASLLYLGWLSSAMLVGVIVFLIIGTVVRQALAAKGTRALKLAREEANRLLNHYRALTEGSKELKLHSRRRAAFLDDEIKGVAQKLQRHNLSGLTSYTLAEGWSRLLFYVFFGLILFVLPAIQAVSVEALTGYTLIVIYIMGPFGALLNFVPAISRARIALAHVDQLSHSLTAVTHAERDLSDPKEPALFSDWGRLELRGVTHSYSREGGEDNFTLGPIDLAFSPGEITYLVGGNGGGKTTLAKLIAGLYAPESGEIRLDGCAITEPQRESYRQLFSVIFSDFFLFDSLLGIGGPDLDQRAEDLLVQLRLDRQVAVKNGTLSRTNLSFGQRKRLAWLTAYLEDRPFYVFDEWAAGQDPEFRDLFYLEFLPQLKRRGKTILAITHDEKYFPLADRLIRLDYGRMTETTARASTEHSMVWPLQTTENGFSRKEALYE